MNPSDIIQACEWGASQLLVFSENVFDPIIYYSHLLPLVMALIIGFLFLWHGDKKQGLTQKSFLVMMILFAVWVFSDLVLWATPIPQESIFFWSLINLIEPLVFIAAAYYLTASLKNTLPKLSAQLMFFALMVPLFILTPTHWSILGFDLTTCDRVAVEGPLVFYSYAVEMIMLVWILWYGLRARFEDADSMTKKTAVQVTLGLGFFLLIFSVGNIIGSLTENWTIEQIGMFAVPVCAFFLVSISPRMQASRARILGTELIIITQCLLIGSLFLIQELALLHAITIGTFALSIVMGILLMMSIHRQVRQQEHLEEVRKALEEANEKLKALDASKNEFLSFATHQLRSPLTAVKWGLNAVGTTLIDQHADPETTKIVQHLSSTTDDLISTVNDLLDISKIEQGGLVMKSEDFDIYDMVGRLVEEFKMTAANKGLALTFASQPSPCIMHGDATKLRQVIVNLIDNAIKYTPSGTITVGFHHQGNRASITVADTGPGIAREELEKLFTKFIRGAAGKASQGGSGLGLYLAKKIVDMHGGKLAASSDGLGKGSTFTIELPVG